MKHVIWYLHRSGRSNKWIKERSILFTCNTLCVAGRELQYRGPKGKNLCLRWTKSEWQYESLFEWQTSRTKLHGKISKKISRDRRKIAYNEMRINVCSPLAELRSGLNNYILKNVLVTYNLGEWFKNICPTRMRLIL